MYGKAQYKDEANVATLTKDWQISKPNQKSNSIIDFQKLNKMQTAALARNRAAPKTERNMPVSTHTLLTMLSKRRTVS